MADPAGNVAKTEDTAMISIDNNKMLNYYNLQWRKGEEEIIEAHVDDEVTISFKTKNIPDNENVNIEIWEQTDGRLMDLIAKLQGKVVNGIVEINWNIKFDLNDVNSNYSKEIKEKHYAIIDYVFVIKNNNVIITSKLLPIMAWVKQLVVDKETKETIRNTRFFAIAPDNEIIEGYTNDEGYIILNRLRKIGNYKLVM